MNVFTPGLIINNLNGNAMTNNSINLTVLNELKEIMGDDFSELVNVFIADGKNQLDILNTAIALSNAQDIRRIAHTIKGSSANLGINKLSQMCKELEVNAADNNLSRANELFNAISNEYNEVKVLLEELL